MTWNPRTRFNAWADAWRNDWQSDLSNPNNQARARFDSFVFDHGFIRSLYLNVSKVGDGIWRSSQPNPKQLKQFANQGFRTIVNLRGPSTWGSYALEKQACSELGLDFIDHRLYSRAPPKKQSVYELKEIFETAQRPLLMHCKSGADRAGIASALYVLMMTDQPPEDALKQLNLRFGHIAASNTGVLDRFVQTYVEFNAKQPISFVDWLDTYYDRKKMERDFRDGKIFSFITDKLMARE